MDGQALELPDASFDVTVSVFGVMLFPDWGKGLREMHRVTKPGGTAAVVTWASPDGAGPNRLIRAACGELFPDLSLPPTPAGMAALSDPRRLADAMAAAGFERPAVATLTERFRFDPAELFAANPWSQQLTADQQRRVIAAVRRKYAANRDGDRLFADTDALLAVARRQ
jgi:SAM-dependent methyltransferase